MPHVNIWIRKADYGAWQAIPNKADWLHEHLVGNSPKPKQTVAPATEPEDEDEYDYLAGLVFQEGVAVWDMATGEKVEATPEMVRELKKRGQVK